MGQIFARAILYLKSASTEEGLVGGAGLFSMQTCMGGIRLFASL